MIKNIPDHLHLGCGLTAPAGWLNVDGSWQVMLARRPWLKKLLTATRIMPSKQAQIQWSPDVVRLNLTRPLPFADGHFAAVYSSHTLEHLYHDDALALLKECYRILQRGGVCRIVVPDLEAMVARYQQAKEKADQSAGTKLLEDMGVHDKRVKQGLLGAYYRLTAFHQHKWMYDVASLQQLFKAAGFSEARRADYLDSRIERIREVEAAGRILDGQGVVVEGFKE